jgi:predicted NBD/HSP70 family sugar kinase
MAKAADVEVETPKDDLIRAAPDGAQTQRYLEGAVGVHIGGATCRAAAGFHRDQVWRGALPQGVDAVCDAVVEAIRRVEDQPRFVVIGTPGHVDPESGEVAGAANLGQDWSGTVPLGRILAKVLGCEVEVRNDADVALVAEKRHGALVAANDGALISLANGVGVALLVDGRDQPTELGHSVLQFDGPPCPGRPHRGCFESYLGGRVLVDRYKEGHPDFDGRFVREIPDDADFWADYGARVGELVVQLCLLGQPMEVISLAGHIAIARQKYLLPAVKGRVDAEASVLGTVPRRIAVTPLGDDMAVLGALLAARDLLYPFLDG